ncbi:MAG: hypothetical protein HYV60_13270 [Planctomycetia bacterium]|nr:hypothetical protein [Planctomycetia bacterium]
MRRIVGLVFVCILIAIWIATLRHGDKSNPQQHDDVDTLGVMPAVSLRDITEMTGITFTHDDASADSGARADANSGAGDCAGDATYAATYADTHAYAYAYAHTRSLASVIRATDSV